VPEVGFEPTRPFEQSILSAPRLPFRHSGQLHALKSNRFDLTVFSWRGI
jgi:hypothetical protein